jgi:hypothetical protein
MRLMWLRALYWAVYAIWLFFAALSLPPIWVCRYLVEAMDRIDERLNGSRPGMLSND